MTALSKKHLYVEIYDCLYKRIMSNEFPDGSRLPSETKLAEMLATSRVTLRQALSLLKEDGLIKSVQGSGNIVTKSKRHAPEGFEKIAHPVHLCCEHFPDDVEMEFRVELTTDYIKSMFPQETTAFIVVDRWYKHKGELIAFTVTFIPAEAASSLEIDLTDEDAFMQLLEEGVYETATSSAVEIKAAHTGSFITNRYDVPEDNVAQLISEYLYFDDNNPCIFNKHYLLTPYHSIRINGTR